MLRARDAMDRSYAEPLDVPSLARLAHVSQAHFTRTFRATFGETPSYYLKRRRIERAMFLLRSSDRSVTDVCMTVGSPAWAPSAGCPPRSSANRRATPAAVLLEKLGPPGYSEDIAAQVPDLISKGAAGGHLFFSTTDAYQTHAELKERGVELPESPTEQAYGIDFGFRDPFGNHIRVAQLSPTPTP
jgi:hypothetical protein